MKITGTTRTARVRRWSRADDTPPGQPFPGAARGPAYSPAEETFPVAARGARARDGAAAHGHLRLCAPRRPARRRDRGRPARNARRLRGRTSTCVSTGDPRHPVLRSLQPTVRELDLPRSPFTRLLEANRLDQAQVDLHLRRASRLLRPLGESGRRARAVRLFRAATPDRIALSDKVCTALQLVEHWQDVAEDLCRRPRLPPAGGSRTLRRLPRRPPGRPDAAARAGR